jgi:hypothetical protein
MTSLEDSKKADQLRFKNSQTGRQLSEIKELVLTIPQEGNATLDARESIGQRLDIIGRLHQDDEPLQEYIYELKKTLFPREYHRLQEAIDAVDGVLSLELPPEYIEVADFHGEFHELNNLVAVEVERAMAPMVELQRDLERLCLVFNFFEQYNDKHIYTPSHLVELRSKVETFRNGFEQSFVYFHELRKRFQDPETFAKEALLHASDDVFVGEGNRWYHDIIPALKRTQKMYVQAEHFCHNEGKALERDLKRQRNDQRKIKEVEVKVSLAERSIDGNAAANPLEILQSNPRVNHYYHSLGGMPECTPAQIRKVHGGHKDTVKRNILRHLEPISGFKLINNKKVPQKGVKYDTIAAALLMTKGGTGE